MRESTRGLAITFPEMLISSMIFFAGYALNQVTFETINYFEEDKEKAIRYKYFYILSMITIILIVLFNAKAISNILSDYL